jgi:hypothetical protein
MTISRAELAELYREDDRQRAEHREFMARREAQASPYVQWSDDGAGLLYRTTDNALLPAAQPEPGPFDEEASTAANFFDDVERNEAFADTMAYLIAELRREWKRDIKRLERQIKRAAESEVVELPNWRSRRNVA